MLFALWHVICQVLKTHGFFRGRQFHFVSKVYFLNFIICCLLHFFQIPIYHFQQLCKPRGEFFGFYTPKSKLIQLDFSFVVGKTQSDMPNTLSAYWLFASRKINSPATAGYVRRHVCLGVEDARVEANKTVQKKIFKIPVKDEVFRKCRNKFQNLRKWPCFC